MQIDLTQIIVAVITLIFGLIAKYAIPYLKEKYSTEQLEKMKLWAKVAVEAAEMLYVGSGRGEEKKKYVLDFLQSKGFSVDFETIENLLESAVLELKKDEK